MADPRLPALSLTLWSGAGLESAVSQSRGLLERVRPAGVQLHATPSELVRLGPELAQRVRTQLPGVVVWFGVAGDAGASQVRAGTLTVATLHARRLAVARMAADVGAQAVVWNCEAAWKLGTAGFTAADAMRLVDDVRALHPGLLQGHTAYDCPTLHSSYPWAGWKACDFFQPQVYPAIAGGAPRGAGAARLALHRKHWARAVAKGWLPAGPLVAYLQAYGVAFYDMCLLANAHDGVSLWAVPTRISEDGARCAQVLATLDRLGFKGPGRIEAFQRSAGLVADGLVGKRTLAALGVA